MSKKELKEKESVYSDDQDLEASSGLRSAERPSDDDIGVAKLLRDQFAQSSNDLIPVLMESKFEQAGFPVSYWPELLRICNGSKAVFHEYKIIYSKHGEQGLRAALALKNIYWSEGQTELDYLMIISGVFKFLVKDLAGLRVDPILLLLKLAKSKQDYSLVELTADLNDLCVLARLIAHAGLGADLGHVYFDYMDFQNLMFLLKSESRATVYQALHRIFEESYLN